MAEIVIGQGRVSARNRRTAMPSTHRSGLQPRRSHPAVGGATRSSVVQAVGATLVELRVGPSTRYPPQCGGTGTGLVAVDAGTSPRWPRRAPPTPHDRQSAATATTHKPRFRAARTRIPIRSGHVGADLPQDGTAEAGPGAPARSTGARDATGGRPGRALTDLQPGEERDTGSRRPCTAQSAWRVRHRRCRPCLRPWR